GLGIPFLLAGLFVHQAGTAMDFVKARLNIISAVGAAVLVVFGVLLATGQMTRITAELQSVGPLL
ncbi:MAG: cytochrome c biogenesis protein CcdA, partial [Miltoncostaeaceae bacterium]